MMIAKIPEENKHKNVKDIHMPSRTSSTIFVRNFYV